MSDSITEEVGLLNCIFSNFELKPVDANAYSPLSLAFIGDSIYGLLVKTVVVLSGNCPANQLNKQTTKYVKAVSQAKMVEYFIEQAVLSEEEQSILRRGRNAKSTSVAKNASVGEYRTATGLEALFGYLYLQGNNNRMIELMKIGMDYIDSISRG